MAAIAAAPGLPLFHLHRDQQQDSGAISTLPDPRSRSSTPFRTPNGISTPTAHHPDLSVEVAALSDKLIRSINHQTDLDDSLAQTRHELNVARERALALERENREHKAQMSSGQWVRRASVDQNRALLESQLAEERKQRAVIEKEKKAMELELETLTGALFEEANEMVAVARKERDSLKLKNDKLQSQLDDAQLLLLSHQEQLSELKKTMHQIGSERDDLEAAAALSTAPSTPALRRRDSKEALDSPIGSLSLFEAEKSPVCPTSFSDLLHPVVRSDLPAFDDFRILIETGRHRSGHSRVNSGSAITSHSALAGLGLNGFSQSPTFQNNGSTSSLGTFSNGQSSAPGTPTTPASSISNVSAREVLNAPPLKETRFYRRAQVEDIEPTLRLENAPGLSWLARRSVSNAIVDGSIVIESLSSPLTSPRASTYSNVPLSPTNLNPCTFCGETRSSNQYARQHRFHISDASVNKDKNAQRYSLCGYCVERLRASCDFISFLRMLREGHWQGEGLESDKAAWDECVKFRERMFWARMGGGVVPTAAFLGKAKERFGHYSSKTTPRSSTDERERTSEDSKPRPEAKLSVAEEDTKSPSITQRESIPAEALPTDSATEPPTEGDHPTTENTKPAEPLSQEDKPSDKAPVEMKAEPAEIVKSESQAESSPPPEQGAVKRDSSQSSLSIEIPGSFDS